MYNVQANSARFIYTISSTKPTIDPKSENIPYCHLKNGFYFTKEPRSDEKMRYTETDMENIVRTILFIYVFEISTESSLLEIITSGQVEYKLDKPINLKNHLSLSLISEILDMLFGDGFSFIVRRVIYKCFKEYISNWSKYPYVEYIYLPSAGDYLKLSRFVNAPLSRYTKPTRFILDNIHDFKIKLQNNVKILK